MNRCLPPQTLRLAFLALAGISWISMPPRAEAQSATLERMREEVEELREQVASLESEAGTTLQAKANIDTARQQVDSIKGKVGGLEAQLADSYFLVNAYRSGFRVTHTISQGEPLPTFPLQDGRSLSGAIFHGTERGGVKVATAGGILLIPADQLPSSLGPYFSLPGPLPYPSRTPTDLIGGRPGFLGPAEGLSAAAAAGGASPALDGAAPTVKAAPPLSAEQAAAMRIAEEEAKAERNKARWAEIDTLRSEISLFFFKRRDILNSKHAKQREFNSRKIRPDPRVVADALKSFDDEINKLDAEERAKMARLNELQREIE